MSTDLLGRWHWQRSCCSSLGSGSWGDSLNVRTSQIPNWIGSWWGLQNTPVVGLSVAGTLFYFFPNSMRVSPQGCRMEAVLSFLFLLGCLFDSSYSSRFLSLPCWFLKFSLNHSPRKKFSFVALLALCDSHCLGHLYSALGFHPPEVIAIKMHRFIHIYRHI